MLFLPIPQTPARTAKPPELAVGDRAPDAPFRRTDGASFRRTDGASFRLSSLRGKIVVLEFTALACPPCRELAPKLEAFAAAHPDVAFLTVSTDAPKATAELLRLRPADARTTFLTDAYDEDRSKMAVWRWGNVAVPTMFVIAPDGTLASRPIQDGVEGLPRVESRIAWARKRAAR